MRSMKTVLLAGLVSVALAGGAFAAREANMHVLSVALPDGSIEQIHYSGDVAPRIVLAPAAAVPTMPSDFFAAAFGPDSPFAEMDRISAEMNRQSEVMLQQAAAMAAQPGSANAVTSAASTNMPAGAFHYTMVSTSSGAGSCTQSVQITSMGEGQQPKVINSSSGDCKAMSSGAPKAAATPPAAAPSPAPVKPVAYRPAEAAPARQPII